MAKFQWKPKLAQFWNATVGKIVPRLAIRQAADAVIDASPVKQWAADVASGRMDVATWHEQMRAEIRRNVLEQYLAGKGGTGAMTARDYGACGGIIADQYRYLDPFAREVADGKLTEGQIARRSEMYVNSAREARERAAKRAAEEAGLGEVRWVMDPDPEVEHCTGDPGCLELSAMGWRKAEPWPFKVGRQDIFCGSGHTPCLTA